MSFRYRNVQPLRRESNPESKTHSHVIGSPLTYGRGSDCAALIARLGPCLGSGKCVCPGTCGMLSGVPLHSQLSLPRLDVMYSRFRVAIWAMVLLAPPVLCRGGVLLHACEPPCCDRSSNCESEEPQGCAHESDCATDPCENLINRTGKQLQVDDGSGVLVVSLYAASIAPPTGGDCRSTAAPQGRPPGAGPPRAEFRMPLLI